MVADPDIAKKLYERFLGRQKSKYGAVRNDQLDLVPITDDENPFE